ncbi:MAG: hypothetical protein AAB855_04540, partial [Patescibacteria group bacterium]
MKNILKISLVSFVPVLMFVSVAVYAQTDTTLTQRLSGRILLQVEEAGAAWYVSPADLKRYYLGRPSDAFQIMREHGLGINNANLTKLFGVLPQQQHILPSSDRAMAQKLAGTILLQVESRGEAYYIDPTNLTAYYLGRPADAFNVMRTRGLGITNEDIASISTDELWIVGNYNYLVGSGDLHGWWEETLCFSAMGSANIPVLGVGQQLCFDDEDVKALFMPKGSTGYATIVVRDYIAAPSDVPHVPDSATFIKLADKRESIFTSFPSPHYTFYAGGVNPFRTLPLARVDTEHLIGAYDPDTDYDQDGLPAALEERAFTDPQKADTDGDGFDDRAELLNAFDPLRKGKPLYDAATWPENYDPPDVLAEKLEGRFFSIYTDTRELADGYVRGGIVYYLGRNDVQVKQSLFLLGIVKQHTVSESCAHEPGRIEVFVPFSYKQAFKAYVERQGGTVRGSFVGEYDIALSDVRFDIAVT